MVCSSLELVQVLPWDMLPSRTIMALNNKISKMKRGLFSGFSLLERLPWSMLLAEAML